MRPTFWKAPRVWTGVIGSRYSAVPRFRNTSETPKRPIIAGMNGMAQGLTAGSVKG